jgi:FkbM family methyltransferase
MMQMIASIFSVLLFTTTSVTRASESEALTNCIRTNVCPGGPAAVFQCIERAVPRGEAIRFVQVGANDGSMLDPLQPVQMRSVGEGREWRGVFVEPVARMMDKLKVNKAKMSHMVHFLRAVVSNSCVNDTMAFFELTDTNKEPVHIHFQGMGSVVKPKRAPHLFRRVELPCVNTAALAVVVNANNAWRPHILMIDIEGHDISFILSLQSWPFGKPLVIAFEVWEAPGKLPAFQIQNMFRFLNSEGYLVLKCGRGEDYVAMLQLPW